MSKQLDLSYRLKTRGTSGRAVLTQLIEPRTIDPRCRRGEEEKDGGTTRSRRKEDRGDERGRGRDDARNGGDSLSACDGTSIFAPSVPPPPCHSRPLFVPQPFPAHFPAACNAPRVHT